jgi:glucose/arabinose dehydrogenase
MKKPLLASVLLISCTLLAGSPVVGKKPQKVRDTYLPEGAGVKVEQWAGGLEVPWSLVFLPGGRALVSERTGRIKLLRDGDTLPYALIEDVASTGEAGLMGLAAHPEFPEKPYIYAMHTYSEGGTLRNRVIRLRDEGRRGVFDRVILDGIPGGRFHDGGRIAFGPDGMLYITTGETFRGRLAQDLNSLAGKILRVTPEGGIPPDNPFPGSPVYSYGHRNPQGLAWQPGTGRLFSSEHGPSGEAGNFANDEINVIVKGANYGWPEAIGAPGLRPYTDPIIVWKEATPPSGMTFHSGKLLDGLAGDLFVATLRSRCLIRIRLDGDLRVRAIERWFTDRYGRLRDVVEGPDGALYFLTNNRDGRGVPRPGDDRIYRVSPAEKQPRQGRGK